MYIGEGEGEGGSVREGRQRQREIKKEYHFEGVEQQLNIHMAHHHISNRWTPLKRRD